MAISYKTKHVLTIQTSGCMVGHFFLKMKTMMTLKLYTNVHSFIHNSPKLVTSQMYFSVTSLLNCGMLYHRILLSSKKRRTIDIHSLSHL